MIINSNIYGKTNIDEPILQELLKTPAVLRLKNISQCGIPYQYYHLKSFSRYDHSVGVMLLLKKLGASVEEQIAGLLHDVSIPAFSHTADWLFGSGRQGIENYHDLIHGNFVRNTEITGILKKNGFDLERILDETNFTLLEKNIPALCADRLDYALRELNLHVVNSEIVINCLNGLINYNSEIVYQDAKRAFIFATNFLELQTQHWGGYESVMRTCIFSDALREAINHNIISENDFYDDEKHILEKIQIAKHQKIESLLKVLESKKLPDLRNIKGEKVFKKFRYVDPKVLIDGELVELSKLDKNFVEILEHHRGINKQGLVV